MANPLGKTCAACTCLPTFGCVGFGILIAIFIVAAANQLFPGEKSNTTGGSTQAWTTATLSQDIMDKINDNKLTYIAAATANGIEWEMLAALHYREAQLRPAGPSGEPIGSPSPEPGNNGAVLCNSFLECENIIARKLKSLAKSIYDVNLTILSNDEDKKNAFLAYNRGAMYRDCTPERTWNVSPYVMNQFDDAHKDMRWPSPAIDSKGYKCENERISGQQDANHGAFTVYVILKGRGNASSPNGAGGGFSGGAGDGSGGTSGGAD